MHGDDGESEGGIGGPDGTVWINADETYTNATIVTPLTRQERRRSEPATMHALERQLDLARAVRAGATSYSWSIDPGDGTKTVYARFYNSSGHVRGRSRPTRSSLDTVVPRTPTIVRESRAPRRPVPNTTDHLHVGRRRSASPSGRLPGLSATDHVNGFLPLVCDTGSTDLRRHPQEDGYL